jgi:8-amino-7-oxononanoate synthase
MELTARLLARGVFVQGIRPPTVPEGTARLRVSLSASHEPDHLSRVMMALSDAMRHRVAV